MSTPWTTVAVSAALAAAASPLLAGWSAALADSSTNDWWHPQKVSPARLAVVALTALGFGALAGDGGRPWPAWWLLAAGGTVLAVVDAQRNLLPARLIYPLASLELAVLLVVAIVSHDGSSLLRAVQAALLVGACWFLLAFAAGGGVGLGDVRVATLTGALLGWLGWAVVMRAQLITVALVLATAVVVAVARPNQRGRKMPVPLGPALILASLLACSI